MTWFAILVSMSATLNKYGVVKWLAASISSKITAAGLSTVPAFFLLLMIYTFTHYGFASHVALFALAVVSNLFASLTPYASAQAPVFFGGKYVTLKDWYKLGFIFLVVNSAIWPGVGSVWWKVLGLY